MKKLLIKSEFIITPYSPSILGQPEKWSKDGVEVLEQPKLEDGSNDDSWSYSPATLEIPEVAEVKEWRVIDQTQGMEEELQVWLSGNIHKYPEGYVVEWVDLTEEWNKKLAIEAKIAIGKKAKEACQNVLDLISGYNLNRELTVEQISVMQTNFSSIEKALQSGRPSLAKAYIAQISPDEVLVTSEMKDMALLLLADY